MKVYLAHKGSSGMDWHGYGSDGHVTGHVRWLRRASDGHEWRERHEYGDGI